jgi:CDP-glycerol glycerophosphotransferase (TagB/SpsB family)
MHRFIAEKTRESLDKYQNTKINFTNLILYQANMDIYPILKYSDMLIADYSSVYFDYLFVDKPILFFPYDYKEWEKSADGVMLDYFKYSPGEKVYTFDNMLYAILKNLKKDNYKQDRKKILNIMFYNQNSSASKLITLEILNMIKNNKITKKEIK